MQHSFWKQQYSSVFTGSVRLLQLFTNNSHPMPAHRLINNTTGSIININKMQFTYSSIISNNLYCLAQPQAQQNICLAFQFFFCNVISVVNLANVKRLDSQVLTTPKQSIFSSANMSVPVHRPFYTTSPFSSTACSRGRGGRLRCSEHMQS